MQQDQSSGCWGGDGHELNNHSTLAYFIEETMADRNMQQVLVYIKLGHHNRCTTAR